MSLGRRNIRRDDNIKMDPNKMQGRELNSSGSGKGRVADFFETIMNLPVT
jgi:hypothetical protein